jgi:hypothetical protein
LARFSTACYGQPSFWDSQPYLHWAKSAPTCGHLGHVGIQLVGFCFSPGQGHALHDSWLED